jgi:ATP-dependent DNA helicase RecQ
MFTNETLELLVTEQPRTPQALASIKGLGRARLERFGALLLKEIAASCETSSVTEVRTPAPRVQGLPVPALAPAAPNGIHEVSEPEPAEHLVAGEVSTEEWTCRVLDSGFSAADAATIRGVPLDTILRHANLAARRGRHVPLEAFLTRDVLERWQSHHDANGDGATIPEPAAHEGLWSLFLACRLNEMRETDSA